MKNIRRLVRSVATALSVLLPLSLPLAALTSGCAPSTVPGSLLTPSNVTEARIVVDGLAATYSVVCKEFPSLFPAGSQYDSAISSALADAKAAVDALSPLADALSSNASNLQKASVALNAALSILSRALPNALPPDVLLGLQAVQALLPDLLAMAGISPAMPTAAGTVPRFANPNMGRPLALSILSSPK